MKHLLKNTLILFILAGVTFSCNKDESIILDKKDFNLDYLIKSNSLNDFSILSNERIDNIRNNPSINRNVFNFERFVELLEIENRNTSEELELNAMVFEMGFVDLEHFEEYNNTLYSFVESVAIETNFLDLDDNLRVQIITEYFELMQIQFRGCSQSYNACIAVAQAGHTSDIVLCTGASIGIAMGSGGIGGVIFQAFCLGAAWDLYSAELDLCYEEFMNCTDQ